MMIKNPLRGSPLGGGRGAKRRGAKHTATAGRAGGRLSPTTSRVRCAMFSPQTKAKFYFLIVRKDDVHEVGV